MDIPKTYNPSVTEDKWYSYWMENGLFNSHNCSIIRSFIFLGLFILPHCFVSVIPLDLRYNYYNLIRFEKLLINFYQ